MSGLDIMEALQALSAEKGISSEVLAQALANGLESAYKRLPGSSEQAYVVIDEAFQIRVFAQEFDEEGEVVREWDDTPEDFGRIAAQTARQVLTQRIREVERDMKYDEYAGREGDIVTGIIQQNDSRYTLLDLGRVEALLPQSEQVMYERAEPNSRLKAYIVEVRKTAKGPQIVVSRTHPGFIRELFKLEVPEIGEGIVEVKACAREPGHRTKIAVWSNDPNIDPVGACVGARGSRVRQVVNELRGEKIDIVPFSEDLHEFVSKALSPAKVKEVRFHEYDGIAEVVVPDHQLSLAIGREGQNARLAARLTGWRVDIKSETQIAEEEAGLANQDWAEGEWVTDADTGEMKWVPADGGEAITAGQWSKAVSEAPEAVEAAETPEAAKAETSELSEATPEASAAEVPETPEAAEAPEASEAAEASEPSAASADETSDESDQSGESTEAAGQASEESDQAGSSEAEEAATAASTTDEQSATVTLPASEAETEQT